jgi:hypothetical protein
MLNNGVKRSSSGNSAHVNVNRSFAALNIYAGARDTSSACSPRRYCFGLAVVVAVIVNPKMTFSLG